MGTVIRLLQAIRGLTKSGAIKSLDDAYRLAQRELGESFSRYKNQIKDAFDAGNTKPSNVIPFKKKEGIENTGKVKKPGEVISIKKDQASGTIMDRIEGASKKIDDIMKEREAMYKPKQGLQLAEGLTRTIARKILDSYEEEILNFKQVCPIEMLDKLDNPITLKNTVQKVS